MIIQKNEKVYELIEYYYEIDVFIGSSPRLSNLKEELLEMGEYLIVEYLEKH